MNDAAWIILVTAFEFVVIAAISYCNRRIDQLYAAELEQVKREAFAAGRRSALVSAKTLAEDGK